MQWFVILGYIGVADLMVILSNTYRGSQVAATYSLSRINLRY